jgi:hypothetical protein
MKYLSKSILILIVFNLLWSQENEPYRIGVDSKSKLKFMPSTSQKNIIETNIRSSFSKAIRMSKEYGWDVSFEMIAQNMFDKIIEEQKIRENLEDCLDEKCAIKLGKLASAKYMIYRDIILIGNRYSISFILLNIETGGTQNAVDDYFKGELFSKKGKDFLDDLMIQLFNGAFPDQDPLPSDSNESVFIPDNQYAPVPESKRIKTIHSKSREVRLSATDRDGDKVNFELFTNRTKNASIRVKNGNILVYSPRQRFVGIDEVNFKVSDGLYNNTGKIIFEVYNNSPTADNLTEVLYQGESKVIYPTLKDVDGDSVKIELGKTKPKKGRVTIRNNRIIYDASPNASGTDKFSYKVTDSMSSSNDYNVTLRILTKENDIQSQKNSKKNGRINILFILLLLVVIAAAGGGDDGGDTGSGSGILDIGITGP